MTPFTVTSVRKFPTVVVCPDVAFTWLISEEFTDPSPGGVAEQNAELNQGKARSAFEINSPGGAKVNDPPVPSRGGELLRPPSIAFCVAAIVTLVPSAMRKAKEESSLVSRFTRWIGTRKVSGPHARSFFLDWTGKSSHPGGASRRRDAANLRQPNDQSGPGIASPELQKRGRCRIEP